MATFGNINPFMNESKKQSSKDNRNINDWVGI